MSSDDVMDWSESPTSWAAVFEGEADLPIPAIVNRSSHKDGKDTSSSPSQVTQVASGSQCEPLRYLPSPFINKFNCLEPIAESADAEAEMVDEEVKSGVQDTEMKRSASCSTLITRTEAQAISIPANKHVVLASVPMQYASSLPSMVVTYPLPDDSLEPRWQRLGFSPTTGVAIRLKLDIPELLRPYEKPPPMTIGQIEKMPLWAQPPVDDCIMRADWAHVHVNYRARVMREFGQDIFIQYPGWWQEVIKGSQGRIAVKSDDHYYTVYCYLPGHTSEDVCIYQAKQAIGIQSDSYQRNEHFHWKIELPQAEFKHITTRMNGTTLTIQIFKQKFLDSFAYDFEPRTAMIAEVDMIPKEIYGL